METYFHIWDLHRRILSLAYCSFFLFRFLSWAQPGSRFPLPSVSPSVDFFLLLTLALLKSDY